MTENSPHIPPQTILVTGATGFLGSYLVRQLILKGFTVKALKRKTAVPPHYIDNIFWQEVQWIEGDILDVFSLEEALSNVDAVIHAAAVVSFNKKNRTEMYQVNVEGTANIVNMMLETGVNRLIHISSVAALGRTGNGEIVTEAKKWKASKNNTHYAKSKHKGEMEVWRGAGEGLDVVVLNPSTILGYGNWHSGSSAIFKKVHDGFNWYSSGQNGFVAVEDVAAIAVQLLESDITDERFIINGENWTFRRLLNTMADGFGRQHPKKAITPFLASIAWRIEKIKAAISNTAPVLTRESTKVAQSNTLFSNEKIKKILPSFQFTPLEEAIKAACAQYSAFKTML